MIITAYICIYIAIGCFSLMIFNIISERHRDIIEVLNPELARPPNKAESFWFIITWPVVILLVLYLFIFEE